MASSSNSMPPGTRFTRTPAPRWDMVPSLYIDEDNFTYRVCAASGGPAQSLAYRAIRAGLFKQDGNLIDVLLRIHAKKKGGSIAIVAHPGQSCIPSRFLGVAVVFRGHCQVYVRPSWRRQGLGSRLIALLRKRGVPVNAASLGERQSGAFWKANDVVLAP